MRKFSENVLQNTNLHSKQTIRGYAPIPLNIVRSNKIPIKFNIENYYFYKFWGANF